MLLTGFINGRANQVNPSVQPRQCSESGAGEGEFLVFPERGKPRYTDASTLVYLLKIKHLAKTAPDRRSLNQQPL